MNILSVTVTNRVVSEYYSPVVTVEYEEGRWSKSRCTREVHQDKRTSRWFFTADNTLCSPSLATALTVAYNNIVEIRKSSRPPPRTSFLPPAVQSVTVHFKDEE